MTEYVERSLLQDKEILQHPLVQRLNRLAFKKRPADKSSEPSHSALPQLAHIATPAPTGTAAAATAKVSFEESEDEGGYLSTTSEEHGFAHNWNEVSPKELSAMAFKAQNPSVPNKSKPCYDYLRGACDLGTNCAYSHRDEDGEY